MTFRKSIKIGFIVILVILFFGVPIGSFYLGRQTALHDFAGRKCWIETESNDVVCYEYINIDMAN